MPFDTEFWSQLLGDIVSKVMVWLPGLAGALVLLLVGWVVARLIQLLLTALLRRLGVDRLSERAGIAQLLPHANLDPSLVKLISRLVYWRFLPVLPTRLAPLRPTGQSDCPTVRSRWQQGHWVGMKPTHSVW